MKFEEIYCDIFDAAENHNITNPFYAHCISADLAMGKGIAKAFDEEFRIKSTLKALVPDFPRIINWPSCFRVGHVYNIVTKERYWHKPTNEAMQAGLFKLRDLVVKDKTETLLIPHLGCGLDKLDWSTVKKYIMRTFSGVDVTIVACQLPEDD